MLRVIIIHHTCFIDHSPASYGSFCLWSENGKQPAGSYAIYLDRNFVTVIQHDGWLLYNFMIKWQTIKLLILETDFPVSCTQQFAAVITWQGSESVKLSFVVLKGSELTIKDYVGSIGAKVNIWL